MGGEIVGLDMSWKLVEGTGFVQEARKYSVLARQIDHCHTEVVPGDNALVEGHVQADLHWGEGDGVVLPDVGELVLPGGGGNKFVVSITEDTVLVEGYLVTDLHWGERDGVVLLDVGELVLPADLHWGEGDGVVLPDVGELVLPVGGGKDKFVVGITEDTVLVEGYVVADLRWGERDGVVLLDAGELVVPVDQVGGGKGNFVVPAELEEDDSWQFCNFLNLLHEDEEYWSGQQAVLAYSGSQEPAGCSCSTGRKWEEDCWWRGRRLYQVGSVE